MYLSIGRYLQANVIRLMLKSMENGNVMCDFLDLKRVFDTVHHVGNHHYKIKDVWV